MNGARHTRHVRKVVWREGVGVLVERKGGWAGLGCAGGREEGRSAGLHHASRCNPTYSCNSNLYYD